jgi:DNA polymerase (family X)
MTNAQVANLLAEIASLLELQQADAFRIRAYHNAARVVRDWGESLEDMLKEGRSFCELPGIGKSTEEKMAEMIRTGTCRRLEELRAQFPSGLTELMQVPGLGPRRALMISQKLGVKTLDELQRACREHRVAALAGMGEKSEQKILGGLALLGRAAGRILYVEAAAQVKQIAQYLEASPLITRWEVAGSFRRRVETIGDLDILVEAGDRAAAAKYILAYKPIADTIGQGEERLSVRLGSGLQVDFRFVNAESFGAAWMYFTGSKAHNIALRRRAQGVKWKLNEYGLFKGDTLIAGKDEASVYRKLDLPWIAPELREDRGEIAAAAAGKLPRLIETGDIRGDLHVHTNASDGSEDIQTMARAAGERGYSFLAITDHSKAVRIANGLDEDRLRRHADEIRRVGQGLRGLWLMAGVEVDILKDGSLDIDERLLGELDWVVASVHSSMGMGEDEMTQRILRAVSSGVVHALGHPLGRLLGKREPIRFHADSVFQACRQHNVCLEINSQPDRLDLSDSLCIQARQLGVKFCISTDAHKIADLGFIEMGVNVARRAWLTDDDVVNTMSAGKLRRWTRRQVAVHR